MSTPGVTRALDGELLIVDGFYQDPDRVRDLALAAEYRDFGEAANFPGLESVKAFASEGHARRLAEIVGGPIHHDPRRWVFGKFRVATRSDSGRTRVHLDFVDWTAVVYLTPPEQARGGLSFYRHLPTGLDRVPEDGTLDDFGCRTKEEFDQRYVLRDTGREDRWEAIHHVDLAYNRCVIFKGGRLFHGITELFGDAPGEGRLTQNFFFMDGESGHGSPESGERTRTHA
ncbi:DUF6445 family protein [Streptomyces sp. UH6]|uniref:DUF6445 family protein n=1 Tax=Streptomyces sp. UH6 TaxID=2748379 RepID=UPI0015D4E279|nr:DUF6445 family protein [Streptomyces sp. UH6]NYV73720.1 hypothetical protein [Streptomyces sp. UH6]